MHAFAKAHFKKIVIKFDGEIILYALSTTQGLTWDHGRIIKAL